MMTLKNLAQKDLNLLVIFHVLGETRHVTKAAKLLGITQPTLSHALKRLRLAFDDQLFSKSSRGLVLTPLAQSLIHPIGEVLERIKLDILERQPFSPQHLDRLFSIRTTDLIECLLVPKLIQRLNKAAPSARVVSRSAGFGLPKDELELGECDLAIAGFFGQLPGGFYQQTLFTDSFMCAVRQDHPRLHGKKINIESFCKEDHLLIAPGGELTGIVDKALGRHRKVRKIAAGVSNFTVSGLIVAQSDCILTAPSRLLAIFKEYLPINIFAAPVDLPSIKIVQAWHQRNHMDPAHRWFREIVKELLG